jgi:ECF sigma factor
VWSGHSDWTSLPARDAVWARHFPESFRVVVRGASVTLAGVSDVPRILQAVQQGDAKAAQELLPLVYEDFSTVPIGTCGLAGFR